MLYLITLTILFGWMSIGLLTGILMDKYNKEDTALRDLFTYAGLGPFIIILIIFVFLMEWLEDINWTKPIIKNKKDNETKNN